MLPAPAPVLTATGPANCVAPARVTLALVVVMSPARIFVPPLPLWVKAPVAVMSPAAPVVNTPVLTTATVLPAVTPALMVRFLPVKARLPVRFTAPSSVEVPVPALWVRLVAVMAAAIRLPAELTVMAPRRVPPPRGLARMMVPVPAVRPRVWVLAVVPLTVPNTVMGALVVASVTLAASVTLSPRVRALTVVTEPPSLADAPPSSVRLESGVLLPTVLVNSVWPPAFTTKLRAPFTVPVKVTAPLPVVTAISLMSVVAPTKFTVPSAVVRLEPTEIPVAPVRLTIPAEVMGLAVEIRTVPAEELSVKPPDPTTMGRE